MWKGIVLVLVSIGLVVTNPGAIFSEIDSEEEVPIYAKWGRMAMEETKKRYPTEQIVDYLHIGREVAGTRTTEKFKFWLRGETKEFGVYIFIEFDSDSETDISWTFTETTR